MRIYQNYEFTPQHRWTKSAIDCYFIGCNCHKCFIYHNILGKNCRMKGAVLELVRKFGRPEINSLVYEDNF